MNCPHRDNLALFSVGEIVDPDALEAVERHLGSCERCRLLLEREQEALGHHARRLIAGEEVLTSVRSSEDRVRRLPGGKFTLERRYPGTSWQTVVALAPSPEAARRAAGLPEEEK